MRMVVVLLLVLSSRAFAAATPDATATEFYRWYLGEVMASREPMVTDRKKLGTYVEPALVRSIAKAMRTEGGLDADPFTYTQDFADDWDTAVHTKVTAVKGPIASTTVTLGATTKTRWQLDVTLAKTKTGWRIRKVFHAPVEASE